MTVPGHGRSQLSTRCSQEEGLLGRIGQLANFVVHFQICSARPTATSAQTVNKRRERKRDLRPITHQSSLRTECVPPPSWRWDRRPVLPLPRSSLYLGHAAVESFALAHEPDLLPHEARQVFEVHAWCRIGAIHVGVPRSCASVRSRSFASSSPGLLGATSRSVEAAVALPLATRRTWCGLPRTREGRGDRGWDGIEGNGWTSKGGLDRRKGTHPDRTPRTDRGVGGDEKDSARRGPFLVQAPVWAKAGPLRATYDQVTHRNETKWCPPNE
eukprot:scaffold1454_cov342-Pavlova_lutheri.AAC.13